MATPTAEHIAVPQETPAAVRKAVSTISSQPEEEYTIVHSAPAPRGKAKKLVAADDSEPLIDTTEALAKNSKKLARLQKKQQKKQGKESASTRVRNFLELPPELLQEVLGHLRPSDVTRLLRLNHATKNYILHNETSIARDIMERRYWVLRQCFSLPVAFQDVDEDSLPALLSPRWQDRTALSKKPYTTHIQALDAQQVCSCLSCIHAWNNLNIILDFAHFQKYLNYHEPIPMIPRGAIPSWNLELTDAHAHIVKRAMSSPLCHATLLEMHLNSITGTILRQLRFPPKSLPFHRHNKLPAAIISKAPIVRPYGLTEADASAEDDSFLEREGRPSYEVPFHRDNYYSLIAYVPNRKWSKEQQRWLYYAAGAHERDLAWVKDRFMPVTPAESILQDDVVHTAAPFASIESTTTTLS